MKKSSADIVNQAISEIKELSIDEIKDGLENTIFLDIREKEETLKDPSINNSIFIPRGLLEFYADEESPLYENRLNTRKKIVVYCAIGLRGALAVKTLKLMGYDNVFNMKGGLEECKKKKWLFTFINEK